VDARKGERADGVEGGCSIAAAVRKEGGSVEVETWEKRKRASMSLDYTRWRRLVAEWEETSSVAKVSKKGYSNEERVIEERWVWEERATAKLRREGGSSDDGAAVLYKREKRDVDRRRVS
jgi:hypothetical protein